MHGLMAAVLTVSILSTGCQEVWNLTDLKPSESRLVAVFIDKTTPDAEWAVYGAAIEQLLDPEQGIGPGDRVVLAPINAATLTTFLPTADVSFPRSGVALNDEDDAELARLRLRAAFDDLREMPRAPWTHIVDAAHVAAQLFRNDERRTKRHLVLLTDGQEESPDINFRESPPDDDTTLAIIERLAAADRIPDLQGVQVYLVGAQASTPEAMTKIEMFWRKFFDAAGAWLRPGSYSRAGTLLRLSGDGQ